LGFGHRMQSDAADLDPRKRRAARLLCHLVDTQTDEGERRKRCRAQAVSTACPLVPAETSRAEPDSATPINVLTECRAACLRTLRHEPTFPLQRRSRCAGTRPRHGRGNARSQRGDSFPRRGREMVSLTTIPPGVARTQCRSPARRLSFSGLETIQNAPEPCADRPV
jgi:hypothetical protein